MPPDSDKYILCILKYVLFICMSVFVLYPPLGDPQKYCNDPKVCPDISDRETLCCLCEVYEFMSQFSTKTYNTFNYLSCILKTYLYEAKLKIYTVLAKLDQRDLCRIGCYTDKNEQTDDSSKYSVVHSAPCKCRRKSCRRRA